VVKSVALVLYLGRGSGRARESMLVVVE